MLAYVMSWVQCPPDYVHILDSQQGALSLEPLQRIRLCRRVLELWQAYLNTVLRRAGLTHRALR
jgi:hypothetical protein